MSIKSIGESFRIRNGKNLWEHYSITVLFCSSTYLCVRNEFILGEEFRYLVIFLSGIFYYREAPLQMDEIS
jgi:hypothetical protein